MNGKVARALRHAQAGKVNMNDVEILSRRMLAEANRASTKPELVMPRARKQAPLQTALPPRLLIVQKPMRLIRKYLQERYTNFSNLTGGAVNSEAQAGCLPKHLLDRMALAN